VGVGQTDLVRRPFLIRPEGSSVLSVMSLVTKRWVAAVAGTALAVTMAGAVAAAGPAAASTSGRPVSPNLKVGRTIQLTKANDLSTFAEAPNGSVYYSAKGTVYVVNGNHAPVPATALPGTVLALAANNTDFFVQTGLTVYEYSRKSDAYAGHKWTLSSPHRPITSAGLLAVGGTIWSWTDWSTDQSGFELATVSEITTSPSHVRVISKSNAYPADMAANTDGLYYQAVKSNGANGYIVRVMPNGSVRRHADANIGTPIALASGRVDLLAIHGNGRTYIDSFKTSTLASLNSRRISGEYRDIAGTSAGLLVLKEPCASLNCKYASVSVLNPGTGGTSGTIRVSRAVALMPGPAAAALTLVGTKIYLVRLGR
jgi:hypothetical protein